MAGLRTSSRRRASAPSKQVSTALPLPPLTLSGLVAAVVAVLAVAFTSARTDQYRSATSGAVTHTFQVIDELRIVLSSVKDAETGQRGYLLTGDEKYLEPWVLAKAKVPGQLEHLRSALSDSPGQQQRFDGVAALTVEKMTELERTIRLRREGEERQALAVVNTDQGKVTMDRLRAAVAEIEAEEARLLSVGEQEVRAAASLAHLVNWGGAGLLLVLISGTAYLLSRDHQVREFERWLKDGQTGLGSALQGERPLGELAEGALRFLSDYLGALVSTVYATDDMGRFRPVASIASRASVEGASSVGSGEGLLGEAIKSGRVVHVRDVPRGYLPVSSGVGSADPRELLIAPLNTDRVVVGAIELAFFRSVGDKDKELLSRTSEPIAFALASSRYKTRLATLLEESQRLAEELKSQQAEMEAQQAELEATNEELNQTNATMEIQTTELAEQRDRLALARQQADAANRYKSEFLANMSHELRTPLNSLLILARLLADNQDGNLSAEQVRSAETIHSAGSDLLVLINDILDLSKIEAGRADVVSEPVAIEKMIGTLERSFEPIARERGLGFRIRRDDGTPPEITTDCRRLEQILKNLLSNAFKFTERGDIELAVGPEAEAGIRFSVRDTGIGIDARQKEVIFEAFRQADGTISRKYGGTGLGLSISRELARLLGGELTVESTVGVGSVFKLWLPRVPTGPSGRISTPNATRRATHDANGTATKATAFDDRDALARRGRLVLVVEDDASFARILFELAHELDFDCVVASTAEEGMALAKRLQPSGILLDVGLPDTSGISVLEQLKRDASTRHIPVHVVSASDDVQVALELGAVGYAIKPVGRGELVSAFQKLQKRDAGRGRVLVVEDDFQHRESIARLLADQGQELVLAGTVREALARLERQSIDCMVLDLSLPDGSGYDLLEKMAEGARYSFPPVIVYTGRDIDQADEERLRRYSQSIIVKGAHSPERLLDEVALFLHRVDATLPKQTPDAGQREAVFEGRRILIVEDDVRNVFALSRVLEPRGAKIEIARNGREALQALDRTPDVALVLMDLMMPEMDGLTAIAELRKREKFKRLPVIALTAKAMPDDREQAIAAGANDYMAKPFEVEKLISLCRVWLPR